MKKVLTVTISFCLLFSVFFFNTTTQAKEKYLPESYQYVFKVGSLDFRGVVDGVEGTGALLYPIFIDQTCGRAGISVYLPCPDRLYADVGIISLDPEKYYYTFGCSEEGILKLEYPSQKHILTGKKSPIHFL